MSTAEFESLLDQFRRSLRECHELYLDTGRQFAERYPHLLDRPAQQFCELMDDHKGLLIKIYVTLWKPTALVGGRKDIRDVLLEHVWQMFSDSQRRKRPPSFRIRCN
jgi:hypothetical protein